MFVSVIHRISDPDEFWSIAEKATANIPADLKLPQFVTSEGLATTICLWEAPSVERLKAFLEPLLARVSKNEYLAITTERSSGLPAQVTT